MTLTGDQVAFLARFSKSPDARFLVSWYEAELRELDVKLRTAKGEAIYQAQGRAQQLEEMIGRITGAAKATPKTVTRPVFASHGFEE